MAEHKKLRKTSFFYKVKCDNIKDDIQKQNYKGVLIIQSEGEL